MGRSEEMKTYRNREQIIKAIDRALHQIKLADVKAQSHLDNEQLLIGLYKKLPELRKEREAAEKQFRKIRRLELVRLPKLKARLSEWDTIPLRFNGVGDTAPATTPVPAPPTPLEPGDGSNDVPQ